MTVESEVWIVTETRVSLAGRVTGADGDIASGGMLNLTAAKDAVEHATTSPTADRSHRYDARIRPDGFYCFLDLPAGDYVLEGRDVHGSEIEAKRVSIPPPIGSGPLRIVSADLIVMTKSGADRPPAEAPVPAGRGGAGAARRADSPTPPMRRRTRR